MVRVKPTDKFSEVDGKIKKFYPTPTPHLVLRLSSFEKHKKYSSD